ncbi:MAG TPA: hypothetical protein VL095_09830 [Flavisolibacter sp.]|nr:hypothetical protein [Flavisolibacter sp.]
MQKLMMLLTVSFVSFSINAQINTVQKKELSKQTSDKPLTIKNTPVATKAPPAAPQSVTQPAEKSLDLFLTDVTVTATKTGTDTYKLQIDYTIMNVDTAAISLGNFGVQGAAGIEGNGQPLYGACGTTAGLSSQTLNPGTKVSGTFYCFNIKLTGTGRPVYLLGITPYPGFKIADQNKAGKRVYFTL